MNKITFGGFGDPEGYEEILMKSPRGLFFIYGMGGEKSKYAKETIIPLTETEAQKLLKNA